MIKKTRNRLRPILLVLAISILFLLFWVIARHIIEPFLFGGYTIIQLILFGVIFACLLCLGKFFWIKLDNARRYILVGCVVLLLTSIYYITMTSLNDQDGQRNFYPALADAFAHGQFHLIPLPSPELLALPDQYAPVDAPGKIWDALLFDGKYYFYFGPIPAIILLMVNGLFGTIAGNAFLMDLFLSLCALMVFLIIYRIWQRKYQEVSWKVPMLCFMTVVLSFPVLWLVGRPSVYEAAISGGQAFLLTGLYLLLLAFDEGKRRNLLLIGAGIAMGLAVGARWSLAVPVILLSILVLVLLFVPRSKINEFLKPVVAYFLPLTLLALCYGYYNFARFGSPFEFGGQFQLMGWGKATDYNSFSFKYLKNNLILYGVIPPSDLSYQYPFITFAGTRDQVAHIYSIYGVMADPQHGYDNSDKFSAIIWLAPLSLAALIPVVGLIKNISGFKLREVTKLSFIEWLGDKDQLYSILFFLAAFGGGIPLLLFFGTTMRYHMDYFPAVGLLAANGILYIFMKKISHTNLVFIKSLFFSFAVYTMVLGVVASITADQYLFAATSPQVIDNLNAVIKICLGIFSQVKL